MIRFCKSCVGIVLLGLAMLSMVSGSLAAEVSTDEALKAIDLLFVDFPGNLLEAQLKGDPQLDRDREKVGERINLVQKLHVHIKFDAYKEFVDKLNAILAKIAKNKVVGKGNPQERKYGEYRVCVYQIGEPSRSSEAEELSYTCYEVEKDILEKLRTLMTRGMGCELTVLFKDESMMPHKHVFSLCLGGPFCVESWCDYYWENKDSSSKKRKKWRRDNSASGTGAQLIVSPCIHFGGAQSSDFEEGLHFSIPKKDLKQVEKLSLKITPLPYWTARRQTAILFGE